LSTEVAAHELSVENEVEFRRLVNMLRLAGGFTLGFARVHHPSLRRRLVEEIRRELPQLDILEVTLSPATQAGVAAELEEAVGQRRPGALFVCGLESMFDLREPVSDAIAMLNFNRDYVVRRFPWPVVFWVPDFAVRGFSRQAIDFWSGRSGVYRFRGQEEEARATVEELAADYDWSLERREKLERREILRGILAELEQSAHPDPGTLARTFMLLAQAADFAGEPAEAEGPLNRALAIYRQIGDRLGEANALAGLGDAALAQARYGEAEGFYQQALPMYRQIGGRLGEANALAHLGDAALARAR